MTLQLGVTGVSIHNSCDVFIVRPKEKKKRNIVKPEKEKRNIVKPVEGDDIQVSIVGTSDDVPLRQS